MKMHHITKYFGTIAMFVLTMLLGCGCSEEKDPAADTIRVSAGLPPVGWIANRIGGGRITVTALLPEGRTPHDYSPSPRDLRDASKGEFFFSTGMPFERRVAAAMPSVKTVDVSDGIKRIPFCGCGHDHHQHDAQEQHHQEEAKEPGHHHEAEGSHHHDDDEDALDPHIWLSIPNVLQIAANIERTLEEAHPEHAATFRAGLVSLTVEMKALEKEISSELAPWRDREFYVYHPAFGYFAAMTGLRQEAIELGGREAGAKRLEAIAEAAKKDNVKVIFVQPQFNPANARALADAIGGEVKPLDPLAADLPANFKAITEALKAGFSR